MIYKYRFILIFKCFLICLFLISFSNFNKASNIQKYIETDSVILKLHADGDYYFEKGKNDSALVYYNGAVALGSKSSFLMFKKAISEFRINDYENAIINFSKSLNLKSQKNKTNSFLEEEMYFRGDSGLYIYSTNYHSIKFTYDQIYYYRGLAKYFNKDYYGATNDITKYHRTVQDSTDATCYFLGNSLINTGKLLQSKKYYDIIISKWKKSDLLRDAYFYRGIVNYNTNRKEMGCLDFSKASELGSEEAFEYIEKYCQNKY